MVVKEPVVDTMVELITEGTISDYKLLEGVKSDKYRSINGRIYSTPRSEHIIRAFTEHNLGYALIDMRFPDDHHRKALYMKNPSTGEIHAEWVPVEIMRVDEALAWRNGTHIKPEVLT